jgi:polar amino acid transport system substrate-binding protein
MLVPLLGLSALVLAACSSSGTTTTEPSAAASSAPAAASSAPDQSSVAPAAAATYGECQTTGEWGSIQLTPAVPGELTVAAILPNPGNFRGDTPETIDGGFEYCIAAEIAYRAGIEKVTVKNVDFAALVAGQLSDYDLAMSGIFKTPEREKNVDFSSTYLVQTSGVLAKKGSSLTAETMKDALLGVYLASVQENWLKDTLKPTQEWRTYQGVPEMNAAVAAGQVDATVLDLPLQLQAEKASNGALEVIGQVNVGGDTAAVLPKGSPNKAAIDSVIDDMSANGQIDSLIDTWLVPDIGRNPNEVPVWTP